MLLLVCPARLLSREDGWGGGREEKEGGDGASRGKLFKASHDALMPYTLFDCLAGHAASPSALDFLFFEFAETDWS